MNEAIAAASAFWNSLAERDPLWAILSDPSKRDRGWELSEFFNTGAREVSLLLHQLEALPGGGPAHNNAALDFGCGVGRLSQALATHFASVVGVDVSSAMLAHARRLNCHSERVEYLHNERADLTLLGDRLFDLIYTDLVLQHLPPDISVRYIAEFLRVLSPEGVLVFQLPSHRRSRRSSEVIAMPASTYRARIEVIETPPHWQRGEKASIVVRVTNISNEAWNQTTSGAIRLGNHWLSPRGAMLIQDDGRTALPLTIEAGGSVTTTIDVNVPPEPGEYLLELDLVHEGLSWFADKGSSTTRFQVGEPPSGAELERAGTIAGRASWDESLLRPFLLPVSTEDAPFPMHGVPRQDVEAILSAHGGRLVLAESDDRGGPEWEGFRYFVRK